MPVYVVTICTGKKYFAGTDDYIYIRLDGMEQSSDVVLLDKPWYNDFERGAVDAYEVESVEDLGDIWAVSLTKRNFLLTDDWFCSWVAVRDPRHGLSVTFPCYRWLRGDCSVILRAGCAIIPQKDTDPRLRQQRMKELEERQKLYRWQEWQPGFLGSIDAAKHSDLPRDVQFDSEKAVHFLANYTKAMENLCVNHFMHMFQSSWSDFSDYEKIFVRIKNTVSEHWESDLLFGYQFLAGCNPVVLRQCRDLPAKFPVTTEMVETSLERGLTLENELKAGNIFLADYDLLDNVSANATDPCTMQHLAAPICLLYRNGHDKLVPIAIQLSQTPGPSAPIFLPTDDPTDWLLAKIWVRSSDFHIHQTVTHLLRTHLVCEVFAIATLRQLPAVHPLYKLLTPHTRFTIAINTKAREELICECGLFDKANATGGGGHVELVRRSAASLTLKSLQLPGDLEERGLAEPDSPPHYHYRDDGLAVWKTIHRYVTEVLAGYYSDDDAVRGDWELQAWSADILVNGFRNKRKSGFPESLNTLEDVVELATTAIFLASAQHAAVNFGQYDWYSWIPNASPTMRRPPPTEKGSERELLLETLADRGRSAWHLGAVWALSQFEDDEVFLGNFPDQLFVDQHTLAAQDRFREELHALSSSITARNRGKRLVYNYLSPDRIPNSVAV
uniref:polyunsaturated fatty acid 5-lipoxygenase isoform X2 n=1 Tax=Myxine glutinosa TaxID=7769 RepID=UPI00358E5185